jgi:hypothetical protein
MPLFCLGQKSTPQVTNMAGLDLSDPNLIVTVSVGEPAITTLSTNQFILTQGFLQPENLPCGDLKLDYYPNPALDDLYVTVEGCETEIESMQLIDIWGRVITTIMPEKDNKVFLGSISPGVYFLRVALTNNESETIKIAKVSN